MSTVKTFKLLRTLVISLLTRRRRLYTCTVQERWTVVLVEGGGGGVLNVPILRNVW